MNNVTAHSRSTTRNFQTFRRKEFQVTEASHSGDDYSSICPWRWAFVCVCVYKHTGLWELQQ